MSQNRTCGECKYRYSYHHDEDCNGRCKLSIMYRIPSNKPSCSDFEPIPPPTNGDVIRQGGNRDFAEYFVYETGAVFASTLIVDKTFDTYEEATTATEDYLNAPADDCVQQNAANDTQTDLCCTDDTESEGKDE